MTSKEEKVDIGSHTPPSHDLAHGHQKDVYTGDVEGVRDDFREDDFMTRNGLNLKSFQRRTFSPTSRQLLTSRICA
jgi:amino acid transporter